MQKKETLETLETSGNRVEGNTRTSTPRIVPGLRWCFTWNHYTEEGMETLETQFIEGGIKYLFEREIGKKSGIPHLQGYIESPIKIRPTERFGIKEIHWEKMKGTMEQSAKYCTKDMCDVHTNIKIPRKLKILQEEQLYNWQRTVENIIKEEPDDRTIYWFWEPNGNMGKTTFCKYLSHKYGAIPLEGKKNDILYCAAENPSDVYIWDLERSMEDHVGYGALEKIKNGYFMCAKYESKPIVRNCPHVLVFANFLPNVTALSRDRWCIRNINENMVDGLEFV